METLLAAPRSLSFSFRLRAVMRWHLSRRGLADLDDHMLRDIGLTRAEARAEAARPIWDAPDHWLQR